MLTRRAAVGAGLVLASVAGAAGVGAHRPTARRREAHSIDAVLIDEGFEMPRQRTAFIDASRRTSLVVPVQLDAPGQAQFMRILDKSRAVAGITSGATLFCLERIAWDHGFRLTGRSQWTGGADEDGFLEDLTAYLSGAQPSVTTPSPLARAYRPSRVDGTLHAWVMRKSVGPRLRHHPEV